MAKVERTIKGLPCVFYTNRISIQEADKEKPSVSFHSYAKATYPDGSREKLEGTKDNFSASNDRIIEELVKMGKNPQEFLGTFISLFEIFQEERRINIENPELNKPVKPEGA